MPQCLIAGDATDCVTTDEGSFAILNNLQTRGRGIYTIFDWREPTWCPKCWRLSSSTHPFKCRYIKKDY